VFIASDNVVNFSRKSALNDAVIAWIILHRIYSRSGLYLLGVSENNVFQVARGLPRPSELFNQHPPNLDDDGFADHHVDFARSGPIHYLSSNSAEMVTADDYVGVGYKTDHLPLALVSFGAGIRYEARQIRLSDT
jgi:hypothetical protein